MLKRPAASAVPVEPPATSASARPSATARAACTIEASGVERRRGAGSAALAMETGASTISTASPAYSKRGPDPRRRTRRSGPGSGERAGCRLLGIVGAVDVDRDDRRAREALMS
jgi:hypothetical protein